MTLRTQTAELGLARALFLTAGAIAISSFIVQNATAATFDIYIDANSSNTVALSGTPNPFDSTSSTTGNLWRFRAGFGFDANSNAGIYEKDANGGIGDATPLTTTISGLTSGQEYGVYVCFLSVPTESWRIRAGLSMNDLTEFQPTLPSVSRITDLGPSGVSGSNRNQYNGFIANATASASGEIVVYIDDGEGTGGSSRTWYEGVAVGDPAVLPPTPPNPGNSIEVGSNGAWTWFNDERVIMHQGFLFSGYVLNDGRYGISRYDPTTNTKSEMIISTSSSQQKDDHNNPSITVLPDNRLLITYSKHSNESKFYYRTSKVSAPASDADWNAEQVKSLSGGNTYNNTYRLSAESNTIYNFHRNINFNPTITTSNDLGSTWGSAIHFIDTGNNRSVRPYTRFCSNHTDRIDLIYTDGHPRNENNSLYHMYYQGQNFRQTDATLVSSMADLPIDHDAGERGSVVYQYSSSAWGPEDGPDDWIPSGRAWNWDICYQDDGKPVCVFQVQKDQVTGSGWSNDRIYYYYARWTGTEWQRRFIAHAGRGLYERENDYGGGMTIDPENPNVIYISSNALNPFDLSSIKSVPLATNDRYELYRGVTTDGGLTFTWEQLTVDSTVDNLRPVVPENHGFDRTVVWFSGTYSTYTNYSTRVLAIMKNELGSASLTPDLDTHTVHLEWKSSANHSYQIKSSLDLIDFPYEIATDISSTGSSTSHTFDIPVDLRNAKALFFRIVELEE